MKPKPGLPSGPPEPTIVRKKLAEAERFGTMAIREICTDTLEAMNPNYDQLLTWAGAFLEAADRANHRNEKELTGTYLFLYNTLQDYAKARLTAREYHNFCEKHPDWLEYLYID